MTNKTDPKEVQDLLDSDLPALMKEKYPDVYEGFDMIAKSYIQTSQELEAANKQIEELKAMVKVAHKALVDSQDWNWISAKEAAEEEGHDYFDVAEMQELSEIATKLKGASDE